MPPHSVAVLLAAETAAAPTKALEWQDCGLQTDYPLLSLVQYSHSPDPIVMGRQRLNRKTWRSLAPWPIQNLTEVVTIDRSYASSRWEQYFSNRFEMCGHVGCPIMPGAMFEVADMHPAPRVYAPSFRATERLWVDGVLGGCATVVYHIAPAAAQAAEPRNRAAATAGSDVSLPPRPRHAICVIQPITQGPGVSDIQGLMTMTETAQGGVDIEIAASGLGGRRTSKLVRRYGVHIHALGDIRDTKAGTSAGGHYNPFMSEHGCGPPPSGTTAMHRKVGDLGNLLVNASTGRGYYAERGNRLITLRGETSVVGRTLILHAQPDNCAAEEGPAGDLSAGARIGMCVIGISEEHDHVRQHDIRMHYTSPFPQTFQRPRFQMKGSMPGKGRARRNIEVTI